MSDALNPANQHSPYRTSSEAVLPRPMKALNYSIFLVKSPLFLTDGLSLALNVAGAFEAAQVNFLVMFKFLLNRERRIAGNIHGAQ